jgi:E-phenylitaconyl-CoA hydratase
MTRTPDESDEELLKSHWRHADFIEGPAAFLGKRAPVWNPDPDAR